MRLSGKRVVLTGGATGIGRATALGFASEGAAVMIGDVDEHAAETVRLIEARGGRAAFRRTDVSDRRQVFDLIAACVDAFGGLDVAFNNAGIAPLQFPIEQMPEAQFDCVMAIDVKGVFNAMQAEIEHMLRNGGGSIVNTTSVAGVIADPDMSPYVAAKHAVVGLTKAAAIEHARHKIRVNAIAPGLVRTPMTERWLADPAFTEAFLAASPFGRAAEPEEVPLGQFDPFLLLDDIRSDNPEEYMKGFPWHPHRGMETITYVLRGKVEHGDSLGNKGAIGPGDVQWMTAGSGIIHQEMPKGEPG